MNAQPSVAQFVAPARNIAWVGVGLDGVLAHTLSPSAKVSIGRPIPKMVAQVKQWIEQGRLVKIVTPRVSGQHAERAREEIEKWLMGQGLPPLECTCQIDAFCLELWAANVVQTVPNTGSRIDRRE